MNRIAALALRPPAVALGKHLALQTPLAIAFSGGRVYFIDGAEHPQWKFRLEQIERVARR